MAQRREILDDAPAIIAAAADNSNKPRIMMSSRQQWRSLVGRGVIAKGNVQKEMDRGRAFGKGSEENGHVAAEDVRRRKRRKRRRMVVAAVWCATPTVSGSLRRRR